MSAAPSRKATMKVLYGPVETEVRLSPTGMISIDQHIEGDESDRAYSSVSLPMENAEAVALEILRLISVSRARG
jgi:hypothetical protein